MPFSFSSINIISVVPKLPPTAGGVGDYALSLAKKLRADFNIETHFVVADPDWNGSSQLEGFDVTPLRRRCGNELSDLLCRLEDKRQQILVIHLSGYGYAKWSLYQWLVDGLELWKKDTPSRALLTIFHELSNSPSWPWKHNFWTYLLQENLFKRMAQLSDRCFANCHMHQSKLLRLNLHQNVPLMPVFSCVGEPQQQIPPISCRKRQLVVFGQKANRSKVYQESGREIAAFCKQYAIEKIVDIGSQTGLLLDQYYGLPVEQLGLLPAKTVSEVMLESIAGWSSYPGGGSYLEKSSVFSAYCAHGMVTVLKMNTSKNSMREKNPALPYLASHQFMNPHRQKFSMRKLQEISTFAYEWYQEHTLSNQAQIFAQAVVEISQTSAVIPAISELSS